MATTSPSTTKPKRLSPPPIKERIVNSDFTPTDIFIRYLMSIQSGTEVGAHLSTKTKDEVKLLWLQVNTNKANADQALQDATQAKKDASDALSSVGGATSDITQLKADLTALTTKVTTIENDVKAIKTDITQIKADIISLKDKLDDAPKDGKNYVRNNGQWVALP